jgi:3-isopropylmalate/(R)-2-methylmalate dehydratase small subunit
MEPFTRLTGRVVPLPARDVDTDQIIPARFLKVTDKLGLGKCLFHDWRHDAEGRPRPDFILNQPRAAGAPILLAGDNFGCGSSREHAPWALASFGFRAIISTSFADIFCGNCLKNGLLPVIVDAATHAALMERALADPATEVGIDLASQTLALPGGAAVTFPIDSFSKQCLLTGVDQLGYILKHTDKIAAYEKAHQ